MSRKTKQSQAIEDELIKRLPKLLQRVEMAGGLKKFMVAYRNHILKVAFQHFRGNAALTGRALGEPAYGVRRWWDSSGVRKPQRTPRISAALVIKNQNKNKL